MITVLLTIISGAVLGLSYIANKRLALEKYKPPTFTAVYSLLGFLFAIPLLFYEFRLPTDTFHWIISIISPFTFGLGSMFGFKAYKDTDASVVGLIGRLSIVFTSIFGTVVLLEYFDFTSYIGLLTVFIGSLLIVYEGGRLKFSKGVIFSILMALGFGLAGALDKIVIEEFSPFTYVCFNNLVVFSSFFIFSKSRGEVIPLLKNQTKWALASALFGLGGWVTFLFALQSGDVSVLYPIWESVALIVTVLLSIVFFKEKEKNLQKIIGVLVTIAGIVLLS